MSPVQLLVLSVALGTDLFSTAIPIGMMRWSGRRLLQASLVFAWFHIVMILTGYGLGHWLGSLVETLERGASGFGAVILILLGICLVRESSSDEPTSRSYSLVGWRLIILAFSVSVDAFAAGVSLGMLDVDLLLLCLILGGVIFAMSLIGLRLGRKIGSYAGPYALRAGGILLTLFGFHALAYLI